jgi:glycosyltransferase involved in cell wall biosynthesis
MKNADVSVIIPFYNNSSTIYRAIVSVYNQTLLPKEIIVVDDCSFKAESDKLKKILKKFNKKKIKIHKLFIKKNSGPATARNVGWNNASSKYLAFLDADDSWHIKKIEIQYKFMENKNILFSAHKSTYKYKDTFNNYSENFKYKKIKIIDMFLYNQFTTPTVMLRRSIFLRFKDKKYYTEDYLLWLEILLFKYNIHLIKLTLTYLHKPSIGVSGLSKSLNLMRQGEIETFNILSKSKLINKSTFIILLIYSYIKQLRRRIFRYV